METAEKLGLMLVPIVAFLAVSNPSYLAAFTEGLAGHLMVATVVVLLTVGGLWLKKTVAIRF